jgi:chondroitin AC lyase
MIPNQLPLRWTLAALACVVGAHAFAATDADADLATLRHHFAEYYLGVDSLKGDHLGIRDTTEAVPEADRALDSAHSLGADGSWPDIDYASKALSGWPPQRHYMRMLGMVAAAQQPDTAAATRDVLWTAVHRAFAFWIQHDFICTNWWYNQIGGPKVFATMAVLMGDELKPEERRYLLETMMPRAKIAMTGQNRVWLAGNTLTFGLVKGDPAVVAQASSAIWHEVVVTLAEGIQPDGSFHQHGPQQQFGNYGLAFATEISRWVLLTRGTRWAMPSASWTAFRGFLLDGLAWENWKGRFDVAGVGRQFMPHALTGKSRSTGEAMRNAAAGDPTHDPRYTAFLTRNAPERPNDLVGTRVFWRSDGVMHRRPDFAVSLKMSSRRLIGAESLNHENRLGYFTADGATYLYRTGDEYDDIFPVWDWRKLPGVTCLAREESPPAFRTVHGERDFVGGVTSGDEACAALDFARDGVTARKSWFFGQNGVLCLGREIRSTGSGMVTTTLNQCLLRGPVRVKQSGHEPVTMPEGERVLADVEWVEHDGWRYVFLNPTKAHLSNGPRHGHWSRVYENPQTPKGDVTENVFTLWLEHDLSVRDGEYAYAVLPAGQGAASAGWPTQVRAADAEEVQMVRFGPTRQGVVFWSLGAADFGDGETVAVDAPCLVMIDRAQHRAFVADPTQKLARINLAVDGRSHEVALPTGWDAGRTIAIDLGDEAR